jgi:hypothetical protein
MGLQAPLNQIVGDLVGRPSRRVGVPTQHGQSVRCGALLYRLL